MTDHQTSERTSALKAAAPTDDGVASEIKAAVLRTYDRAMAEAHSYAGA